MKKIMLMIVSVPNPIYTNFMLIRVGFSRKFKNIIIVFCNVLTIVKITQKVASLIRFPLLPILHAKLLWLTVRKGNDDGI